MKLIQSLKQKLGNSWKALSSNKKITFLATALTNIVVIYVVSYFTTYISVKFFSGLDAYWEAKRLNSIHEDVLYIIPWELQIVAVSIIIMAFAGHLNIIKFAPRCITYCFIVSITYAISTFIVFNLIVPNVNSIIYGIDAGILGWIGLIEEFAAGLLFVLPLFLIISVATRLEFKNFKSLAMVNALTYVAIFVVDKITTDYWFPPLVNYGS